MSLISKNNITLVYTTPLNPYYEKTENMYQNVLEVYNSISVLKGIYS